MEFSYSAATDSSPPSDRVVTIRHIFGLSTRSDQLPILNSVRVPSHGLTFITGVSGSGKSTLLRLISEQLPQARSPVRVENPYVSIVDLLAADLPETIRWLGQFGLGEARLMTNQYRYLSDGQKERLRLALLLQHKPACIIIDEFLSILDRLTAKIVAFNLQKILRQENITAYIASSHDDLIESLAPDHVIRLELDGSSKTFEPSGSKQARISELDEIEICDGSPADYRQLAMYHYVDQQVPIDWDNSITQIRTARFRGDVVGITLCSTPLTKSLNEIPFFKLLNQSVIVKTRTIVHPVFRGVGLTKLLQPRIPNDCRCVLAFSAMGQYYPFPLGAGFELVGHPRNLRHPAHDQLESFVSARGKSIDSELIDYTQAQNFYDSLPAGDQAELRQIVSTIIVRNNVDYCLFLAHLCRNEINTEAYDRALYEFFNQLLEQVEDNEFGPFICEATYFRVQAFIKYVN